MPDRGRVRGRFRWGAVATALGVAGALLPSGAPVATAAPATTAAGEVGPGETAPGEAASDELPDVVPSVDGWQAADAGEFTAADGLRIVTDESQPRLDSTANLVADELATLIDRPEVVSDGARAGDLVIELDGSRAEELGEEGYELVIGDRITITANTPAGAFYGTRTVMQLLTQQLTLPAGQVVDVPKYRERGVTLCACVINVSPDWIDRLLEEMSYLKLNNLLLEMKLKVDEHPETNTWSYYTKDDVAQLVAKAREHNIEVIPEINSPGHMEIWLENKPELQLENPETGERDEVRMDITRPESFEFYTSLIDEYYEVFDSEYWHMGVDEYMLGSSYENYPQIGEFAEENFGPGATEDDVVAWYVNQVNDYVKGLGKTLRIWNDGVMTDNQFVDFDTDIVIEHWNQAGSSIRPQQFLDWGHQLMNASNSLYMVRGGYGVDARGLYEDGWNVGDFYGQSVDPEHLALTGAKFSMWPDGGTPAEAENTTEERMFEALRFTAQSTWSASRPWADYDGFRAAMDAVGRPPGWNNVDRTPLPAGAYTFSPASSDDGLARGDDDAVVLGDTADDFTLTPTSDGYYTITTPDGRCLDVSRSGTIRLNVPVEIGVDVEARPCETTTIQRWQLKPADGGFHVVNAATQQHLAISDGLVDVPVSKEDPKTVPDGRVVQAPHDWVDTVWTLTGQVGLGVVADAAAAAPGESVVATVTVRNGTDEPIAASTLEVGELPTGWTATPRSESMPALEPLETATVAVTVHNINATTGGRVTFDLVDGDGTTTASAGVDVAARCATGSLQPTAVVDVSSEQTTGEPAPNGFAAAAIDGDVATYWHSRWSPTEATHPHGIVVDLGSEQEICGVEYTGRQGSANGRIADYAVYASPTVDEVSGDWGEPVATGTFTDSDAEQTATFAPVRARYVKLVALSEVSGNPWATVGELAVAGPAADVPGFSPEVSANVDWSRGRLNVSAVGTGLAPGEPVTFTLDGIGTVQTQTDADGLAETSFTVHPREARGTRELVVSGAVSEATDAIDVQLTPGARPFG